MSIQGLPVKWSLAGAFAILLFTVASVTRQLNYRHKLEWIPEGYGTNIYNFQERLGRGTRYTLWGEPLAGWELDTSRNYTLSRSNVTAQPEPQSLEYFFEVRDVKAFIGGKAQSITTINGQYPGPLIEAVEGDHITIHLINRCSQPTALHIHGYRMEGITFYDGAVGVNQCAILPGRSFTYKFNASQAGTYWYHSHWSAQYAQGLIGPMVVHAREQQEVEHVDGDMVVLISDIYNKEPADILNDYHEPWVGGDEPVPDFGLIQGRTAPIIHVEPQKKYRFRIINASSSARVRVSIDSIPLLVIEADGIMVEPVERKVIPIVPGQRYSVVFDGSDIGSDDWAAWFRATIEMMSYDLDERALTSLDTDVRARITHNSNKSCIDAKIQPQSSKWTSISASDMLTEHDLVPINKPAPPEARQCILLQAIMDRDGDGVCRGRLNETIMSKRHAGNMLLDYLSNSRQDQQDADSLIFDSPDPVDFVIRNMDDGPHPFHLHGHHMWLIESGLTNDTNFEKYQTPSYRDTVWVPPNGWLKLRIVPDNPGIWALHCHNIWHAASGMEFTFVSHPERLVLQKPPTEWFELCKV